MIYIFDGSFNGLLCCVFECFEMKEFDVKIYNHQHQEIDIFQQQRDIFTDDVKANRVLIALKKRINQSFVNDLYRAYLSEDVNAWQAIIYIVVQIFKGNINIINNYGDSHVIYFHQTLKKVSRERHRMKAFIRFSKSNDGLFYAIIEPDYNVLPLILSFFKNRYTDQQWLIYDIKRKYGIYYDTKNLSEVKIDNIPKPIKSNAVSSQPIVLDDQELLYQQLWKRYFKSTNIVERKNLKLHLQHVPKRYWKYLVEKN